MEIQLLGDLFSNGRHFLQQLRVLFVVAVGWPRPFYKSSHQDPKAAYG
jgi:hypothetical protein